MQKQNTGEPKAFEDIINLILIDKDKGMEAFHNSYAKLIKMAIKKYRLPPDKANVAYNSVLIKVWNRREKLHTIKNPDSYIFSIAVNSAKDEMKQRWHNELNEKICSGKNYFDDVEAQDSFYSLIENCSEEEYEICTLKFTRGLSFKEIAKNMRKPLPTVSSIYYRSLDKLEKIIENLKNFE